MCLEASLADTPRSEQQRRIRLFGASASSSDSSRLYRMGELRGARQPSTERQKETGGRCCAAALRARSVGGDGGSRCETDWGDVG
jgi:hypothetical protein